ncbi:MAG: translesion error-prone DNA polymerase V autoproteolytic subunit [Verrucomicrobia bacterium]|nr:translesion error-prone DNA polymerase V autoproteolytic subunit [Verrucomicrobiota bacterium]
MPKPSPTVKILGRFEKRTKQSLPLYLSSVPAGFPSPAEDHIDRRLDLNEMVVRNPDATFFLKVKGDSMEKAGIFDGDILVVDRSVEPVHKKIVVAVLDGELTVKRLYRNNGRLCLMAEKEGYPAIPIAKESELKIWGVVICSIHAH